MNKRNLTRKQKVFLKTYLEGKNATQAALIAYNTTNSNSAKVIGSRLLTNANIKEAIDESLRSQGLSLSTIAENLSTLANSQPASIPASTVLKANIEILKLMGVYPNKDSKEIRLSVQSKTNLLTFEEAKKELLNRQLTAEEFLIDAEMI